MTYLERKHPERWGRRDRLEIDIDPRQALAGDRSVGRVGRSGASHFAVRRRLGRGIRPGRNEVESVNRPVTIGGVLVRPDPWPVQTRPNPQTLEAEAGI